MATLGYGTTGTGSSSVDNNVTSLNQFLTKLSKSQLRTTNLFEIEVRLPRGLLDAKYAGQEFGDIMTYSGGNILTMYGESFTLPNRTIEFTDAGFKGFNVPVPTVMRMEQDHTMTVRADMQGNNRRAFLAWQGYCISPIIKKEGTNPETGSPDIGLFEGNRRYEEESQIRITLLGSDMRTATETCVLYGVKISSVGGLTVSNTDASISTFEVGFKSVFWQVEDVHPDSFAGKAFTFRENQDEFGTAEYGDFIV